MTTSPIYTIGYGHRSIDEFKALLDRYAIGHLIDVRSRPYSRYKPEFSKSALADHLQEGGIRYIFLGDKLGGIPDDEACYSNGKVDYDKCREQPGFQEGIRYLHSTREKEIRVALMCAEAKPENCHRSKLIAVSLLAEKIPVIHVDESGKEIDQEEVRYRITGGQLDLFDSMPD